MSKLPATANTSDIFSQTPRHVAFFDLSLIDDSAETQHRVGINMTKVVEYAAEMQESPENFGGFPAVWLVEDANESRYWIARGHHRIAAARHAGLSFFPAEVYSGTRRDAVLLGAGSNADHGYKRSRDDLQHELDMFLLDDEWSKWSDGHIARLVRCARRTVSDRRANLVRQGLISKSSERVYKDRHGHINVMQTGNVQAANAARTRVLEQATLNDLVAIVRSVVVARHANAGILRMAADPDNPTQKNSTYYDILNAVRAAYRHAFDISEMLHAITIVADEIDDAQPAAKDTEAIADEAPRPAVTEPEPEPLDAVALTVTQPEPDTRIELAERLIAIYRAAIETENEYGALTGCYTDTLAMRRYMQQMIDRCQRLIDVLTGHVVEKYKNIT